MSLSAPNVATLGYVLCEACSAPVLDCVAHKTRGHCAECFRQHANEILDAAMTVVAGKERLVLRPLQRQRTAADRAGRKRTKARARQKAAAKARNATLNRCHQRALRRMRDLFPELFQVLLADERAKAGLDAWTIEGSLTPGEASSSLHFLQHYHHGDGAGDSRGPATQQ